MLGPQLSGLWDDPSRRRGAWKDGRHFRAPAEGGEHEGSPQADNAAGRGLCTAPTFGPPTHKSANGGKPALPRS
jgi:hypothetical protein